MFIEENEMILLVIGGSFTIAVIIFGVLFLSIQFNRKLLKKQRENFQNILQATEHESQRIGQNFHDDIGPLLAAIKLNLNSGIANPNIDSGLKDTLSKGADHLTEIIKTLRDQSHDLTSSALLKRGLISALEERFESLKLTGLWTIEFIDKETPELTTTNAIVVYRILTECIHNSLKHSEGDKIWLELKTSNELFQIHYRDNGIGGQIDSESNGIGLNGILSRVRLLGGQISLNERGWLGFDLELRFKKNSLT